MMAGLMDGQTYAWIDRWTTDGLMDRWMDWQAYAWIYRWATA